ncbi:MAG TPA: peroxide stress protein YaaA [Saprospiraceae bacterium]|nr:peroxide stress protein YaaA [Saprospiraceae bacterium]
MLILLSPAKRMDEKPFRSVDHTTPRLLAQTNKLIKVLKNMDPQMLSQLMDINMNLAALNVTRFQRFGKKNMEDQLVQALFAFQGDVYRGLQAQNISKPALDFAQDHLRILSGLYGLLKPLDMIMPYRLEMGTSLKTGQFKNLYDFWGDKITRLINKDLTEIHSKTLINLASQEYFSAVIPSKIKASLYNLSFKQYKDGKLLFITIFGKQARGLMTRFILENKISDPNDLKGFNMENYHFEESLSGPQDFVFVR